MLQGTRFTMHRAGKLSLLLTAAALGLGGLATSYAQTYTQTEKANEKSIPAADGTFRLTILHNNDGESQLVNAGDGLESFGGVARFKTLVDAQKTKAASETDGYVLLSSGDNFLAGPEFNASLQLPLAQAMYDAVAMDLIGYDAIAIGNHDFDFGPDVLARFISGFAASQTPFLSANLDFTNEPALNALKSSGRIAGHVVIDIDGEKVGVVGATTPQLSYISSPRNVGIDPDVAGVVQGEIDALTAQGIKRIILISHLQSIREDSALAAELTGVDVMIAGGGDELLSNPGDSLIPGNADPFGPYPLVYKNADGDDVYVVTTPGDYRYLGRLVVEFDENGVVTAVDNESGLLRVAGTEHPDGVEEDAAVTAQVVTPVLNAVESLAQNVIGSSDVVLDGTRNSVRLVESNEGNLIADALLWQAADLADEFGTPMPDVALQNGGGIRNNNLVPAGEISELTTFGMVPFANFTAIVPQVPAAHFKEILENAVSDVQNVGGRFAQISGFRFVFDPNGTAQAVDANGNVTTPGTRVRSVVLNDGRVIVRNGQVVPGAPNINVATIDFLARGGDQYPFRGLPFTTLGVTYQQALSNYIVNGLEGEITGKWYPEGGSFRIRRIVEFDETNLPASIAADGRKVVREENGVQVINGGFGSGMAIDPITPGYFYMMTDRGPNVDGTDGDHKVFPVPDFAPQIAAFTIAEGVLHKVGEISLKRADGTPLTGLPNPAGAGGTGEIGLDLDGNELGLDAEGLDPEGLVALSDGTFWISDEYGPHILHVDAQGRTIERINPFGTGLGGRKLPKVFATRRANRGMEGLAITPDGVWLAGMMQSPMYNPASDSKNIKAQSRITRLVMFNVQTGATRQYIYVQEIPDQANSEIIAVSNTEFLVLERDGLFPGDASKPAQYKQVYRIDISNATDVSDPADSDNGKMVGGKTLEQLTPAELEAAGIRPVTKQLALDILTAFPNYPHDKPEGIALVNDSTLAIINDDDFGILGNGSGGIITKVLPRTAAVDANVLYFAKLTKSTSGIAGETAAEGTATLNASPNPFSGSALIRYTLAKEADVRLAVFDMYGREVARLADGTQSAGTRTIRFNAGELAEGTYMVRLQTDETAVNSPMILVR